MALYGALTSSIVSSVLTLVIFTSIDKRTMKKKANKVYSKKKTAKNKKMFIQYRINYKFEKCGRLFRNRKCLEFGKNFHSKHYILIWLSWTEWQRRATHMRTLKAYHFSVTERGLLLCCKAKRNCLPSYNESQLMSQTCVWLDYKCVRYLYVLIYVYMLAVYEYFMCMSVQYVLWDST